MSPKDLIALTVSGFVVCLVGWLIMKLFGIRVGTKSSIWVDLVFFILVAFLLGILINMYGKFFPK